MDEGATEMITQQQVIEDMRCDERQRVEFKERLIKTGELAECIMALANAEGGTLYLGIAERPKPHLSGKIRQVTKTQYDNVHRAARDLLVPPVEGVTAHEVKVQGEKVLAIVVPRTGGLHQHRNGRIVIRRGSENVALLGNALRQALLDAQNGDTITFDPAVFLPTAPVTISITSELPGIEQGNLTIDASNAGVILDGSSVSGGWVGGLQIVSSDGNTIRGLQVSNFSGAGIAISGGAYNTIGGDRSIGAGPFGQGNLQTPSIGAFEQLFCTRI